ncbi:hypothetical protein HS5_08140 [Acidianus sp. HS-5]|nr:hypothetical protein HS5_08140 [Acidianus sp. HS-5]
MPTKGFIKDSNDAKRGYTLILNSGKEIAIDDKIKGVRICKSKKKNFTEIKINNAEIKK